MKYLLLLLLLGCAQPSKAPSTQTETLPYYGGYNWWLFSDRPGVPTKPKELQ